MTTPTINHPHARRRRRDRSHPPNTTTCYRPRATPTPRRVTPPPHHKPPTTPPQQPLAYNPTQAPKHQGISRTQLYEEMNRGHIRARKLGRRTLIPHTELERYLASLPPAT